jgi:hypothetical protein
MTENAQVRLDRRPKAVCSAIHFLYATGLTFAQDYIPDLENHCDQRKLARVRTAKAQSQSIASSTLDDFFSSLEQYTIPTHPRFYRSQR